MGTGAIGFDGFFLLALLTWPGWGPPTLVASVVLATLWRHPGSIVVSAGLSAAGIALFAHLVRPDTSGAPIVAVLFFLPCSLTCAVGYGIARAFGDKMRGAARPSNIPSSKAGY